MDSVIPPVLDAVAFHRNTPLLLSSPTRVLKEEVGSVKRRAILLNHEISSTDCAIHAGMADEIDKMLNSPPVVPRTAMRWLRNTYRLMPIRDWFMFAWLALESLAGSHQVEQKCQHCGKVVGTRTAANKDEARRILNGFGSGVTDAQFDRWWNKLRNSVFHGGKEPNSAFFSELWGIRSKMNAIPV
jgi:hypothetical protein